MKATAKNGDEWTGDKDGPWWIYSDKNGNLYESKEVPVYRISMDNAKQVFVNGEASVFPILFTNAQTTQPQ